MVTRRIRASLDLVRSRALPDRGIFGELPRSACGRRSGLNRLDSFGPEESHFTFDWFDEVLAQRSRLSPARPSARGRDGTAKAIAVFENTPQETPRSRVARAGQNHRAVVAIRADPMEQFDEPPVRMAVEADAFRAGTEDAVRRADRITSPAVVAEGGLGRWPSPPVLINSPSRASVPAFPPWEARRPVPRS